MYFAHLRFWVPVLGRVLVGQRDAYAYILESLENYPAQSGVYRLMEECGFDGCGFEEFWGGAMAINFGVKPVGCR
jgi:ubiquinone/menaquinone biosynthesis C-methylase UbiE